MSKYGGRIFIPLLVGMFVMGSGCTATHDTQIAQIDPYLGSRPAPIRRIPHRSPPPKKRILAPSAQRGWIPRGGISNRWKAIVIHHSASDRSTPQGMRNWHVNGRGWVALGYHFVIGNGIGYQDGKIYVGERWKKQMHGAHCKTPGNYYNNHGIGICLIGNLDQHPPTAKQNAALARLVAFLTQHCGIPQAKILTHGGVTGKTACPGMYFSLKPVIHNLSIEHLSASSQ